MIEALSLPFFQNALLGCLFAGAALSVIGVFVFLLDIPFLGMSLSHAAFLGALAGLLTGIDPLAAALFASALSAALLGPLADRARATSNAMSAIFFSTAMGAAFLLLSMLPGPRTEALQLMWGSLLTLSRRDVLVLLVAFAALLCLLAVFYKEIAAVLFCREIAACSGIPEKIFFYGILLFAGILISASLDIVGGLLIFALLVNPPAAAFLLSRRLKHLLWISAGFGIASCLGGLCLSFFLDIPTGAVIALFSSLIFFTCLVFSREKRIPAVKNRFERSST